MNRETYEALKDIIDYLETSKKELASRETSMPNVVLRGIKQVNDWIDEVAKEYEE